MALVIGLSGHYGTGKSTLAKVLAERLEGKVVSMSKPVNDGLNALYSEWEKIGLERPKEKLAYVLQFLSTELGMKQWGDSVWGDVFVREVQKGSYGHVVVNDSIRVKGDAEAIKKLNGILIRLECPEDIRLQRSGVVKRDSNHLSETDLDNYKEFDLIYDTSKMSAEEIAEDVIKKLRGRDASKDKLKGV